MNRAVFRRFFLTYRGHLVCYGILGFVSMAVTTLYLNYTEGTLTGLWAAWCIFISALAGWACASLIWFVIMRPMVRAEERRRAR